MAAFLELEAKVDGVLFEGDDLARELVDVVGGAETGLVPSFLAEGLREVALELVDAGGWTGGALLGIVKVGLEGCSADGGPDAGGVDWLGLCGVDLGDQVGVAVDEAAVDPGAAGDADDGDLVAVVDGVVERGQGTLATADGVGALLQVSERGQ